MVLWLKIGKLIGLDFVILLFIILNFLWWDFWIMVNGIVEILGSVLVIVII